MNTIWKETAKHSMLSLYSVHIQAALFNNLGGLNILLLKYNGQSYMSLYANLCQSSHYKKCAFQYFKSLAISMRRNYH